MNDCTFDSNAADVGGALCGSGAVLTLRRCRFEDSLTDHPISIGGGAMASADLDASAERVIVRINGVNVVTVFASGAADRPEPPDARRAARSRADLQRGGRRRRRVPVPPCLS